MMMSDIGDDSTYYDTSTTYSYSSMLNWVVADNGRQVFMSYPNGLGIYPTWIKGYNPSDISPRFDQNPADPNWALKIGDAPALKTFGHNFYAATVNGSLFHYTLNTDYSLVDKNNYQVVNTGANPHDIAVAGSTLYTANMGENTISSFNLDGAGVPTFASTLGTGITPGLLATSIDGTLLFASSFNNLGSNGPFGFQIFTIGSDGSLNSSEIDDASKLTGFDGSHVTITDMAVVDIINTPQVIAPHPATWNWLPADASFTITLPFYINPATVNTDTVKLYDSSQSEVAISIEAMQSISEKNYLIKPKNPLKYSTGYSLVVNGAVDTSNNPINSQTTEFFTADYTPSVTLASPDVSAMGNILLNESIVVDFSTNVDANTVNMNTVYLSSNTGKINLLPTGSIATDSKLEFSFVPETTLNYNQDYTLVIDGVSSKMSTQKVVKTTYTFHTRNQATPAMISPIGDAAQTINWNGQKFKIKFGDYINKNDVLSKIHFAPNYSDSILIGSSINILTSTWNDNELEITFDSTLSPNLYYALTIDQVMDQDGGLEIPVQYVFKARHDNQLASLTQPKEYASQYPTIVISYAYDLDPSQFPSTSVVTIKDAVNHQSFIANTILVDKNITETLLMQDELLSLQRVYEVDVNEVTALDKSKKPISAIFEIATIAESTGM